MLSLDLQRQLRVDLLMLDIKKKRGAAGGAVAAPSLDIKSNQSHTLTREVATANDALRSYGRAQQVIR